MPTLPTDQGSTSKAVAWLQSRQADMLRLLEELVNTDSSSRDKAAVDRAGDVLRRFFATQGIAIEVEPQHAFGDVLRACVPQPDANDSRPILLMGHRDTVFPPGEAARRPFRIDKGMAYGPGVADMKAGLVVNAFVLAAFHAMGGHPSPLVALITSDEEIASPACRPVIEREARSARVALNSEPGRASGNIVSGRKGGVFMRFEVFGRPAHSGANFADGRSAIGALAHKILKLHALTDLARGTTVNVGLVSGGQSVNTVAAHATGEIDLRYVRLADRQAALDAIGAIMNAEDEPGTSARFEIAGEFLPLEQTPESQRLMRLYLDGAAELGMAIDGEFTGGCADSGFAAAQGTPTLCGLGGVGGKAHTPDEYLDIETLVPRAQALAQLITRLGEAAL
ncbi:MAG: M20 family metallopeptidase [Rhodospirillales bacterium]|nr:M20 family metallopeptidase [Rhodospirillales bacterium]